MNCCPPILLAVVVAFFSLDGGPTLAQEPVERTTLTRHTDWVMSVAISPDGKTLASGSRDATIRLWDITSGKLIATIEGYDGFAYRLVFSPDGKTLASAGADERIKERKRNPRTSWGGVVKLWDVSTRKERAAFRGHENTVVSLAWSPDGRRLASGDSFDGTIKLWDVGTGRMIHTLTGHTYRQIDCLAFSPDGKTLASSSTGTSASPGDIRLWEVATGKERATLLGHTGPVESVAFSPNGKTLASGSSDEMIRLWDTVAQKTTATLMGHHKASDLTQSVDFLAFSRGGERLFSVSQSMAKLWGVATTKELATIRGESFMSAAISPDGRVLACGRGDGTIKLWDLPMAPNEK
jgi:WD40 repeat protein